jgi:hypothetical protein
MTVRLADDGVIVLEGTCPIEDSEALLRRLSERPGSDIDWSGCEQAHTAVVQILIAARPRLIGSPANAFLNRYIASAISDA